MCSCLCWSCCITKERKPNVSLTLLVHGPSTTAVGLILTLNERAYVCIYVQAWLRPCKYTLGHDRAYVCIYPRAWSGLCDHIHAVMIALCNAYTCGFDCTMWAYTCGHIHVYTCTNVCTYTSTHAILPTHSHIYVYAIKLTYVHTCPGMQSCSHTHACKSTDALVNAHTHLGMRLRSPTQIHVYACTPECLHTSRHER